jgi:hypothetical protein
MLQPPIAMPFPCRAPTYGEEMAARRYVHMRASTADLDRSVEVLKTSFVEGRLTRQELDQRVGQALVSRFFAELMALTEDLPVGTFGRLPAHSVTPPFRRTRRLAVAAEVLVLCGFAMVLVSLLYMPAA